MNEAVVLTSERILEVTRKRIAETIELSAAPLFQVMPRLVEETVLSEPSELKLIV